MEALGASVAGVERNAINRNCWEPKGLLMNGVDTTLSVSWVDWHYAGYNAGTGDVVLVSEGKGSDFWLFIPLAWMVRRAADWPVGQSYFAARLDADLVDDGEDVPRLVRVHKGRRPRRADVPLHDS